MSLATTTITANVGYKETELYVASLSGILLGSFLNIGSELMRVSGFGAAKIVQVLRGQGGTATVAHTSGDTVMIGVASDFDNRPMSAITYGTPTDHYTAAVVEDSKPTADTTTTQIATVVS
jgi:hypothetical protein